MVLKTVRSLVYGHGRSYSGVFRGGGSATAPPPFGTDGQLSPFPNMAMVGVGERFGPAAPGLAHPLQNPKYATALLDTFLFSA